MSVRENEQRDASWRDCRCSIINRYCTAVLLQPEQHNVADSVCLFVFYLFIFQILNWLRSDEVGDHNHQ